MESHFPIQRRLSDLYEFNLIFLLPMEMFLKADLDISSTILGSQTSARTETIMGCFEEGLLREADFLFI